MNGRAGEARELLRRAAQINRDLRLPWDLGCVAITIATVLDPSDPDLEPIVAEGRRALEQLGAKPFVTRLNDLVAAADAARVGSLAPSAGSRIGAETMLTG